MSFHVMSLYVILCYVILCHFRSFQVISCVIGLFRLAFNKVGAGQGQGRGRVKYVFLGLRRQLCCQAEGKKAVTLKAAFGECRLVNVVQVLSIYRFSSLCFVARREQNAI
jgi:hypothetical protein